MTVADFERLFDYGYWANRKLFAVIAELPPGQFTQPVTGAYGSIRNTLVHVLNAEWLWLDRCGGPAREAPLKPDDFPTCESLAGTWGKVETWMRAFLASLKDEDLAREIEFTFRGGRRSLTLAAILQHAANHGAHHRGQVTLLLRSLGHVPVDVDLLLYDFEMERTTAS